MKYAKAIGLFLFLLGIQPVFAQHSAGDDAAKRDSLWNILNPYFSPPEAFKGKMGDFRSPLTFYNGKEVKTKKQWKKRRKEIAKTWNELMGEWPDLLKKQHLEKVDSVKKDGYTQYEIRFNWLPDEATRGYLLVPDGIKKGPAVVSVYYNPEAALGIGTENRDYALQLAKRGFVTLSLGTTEATEAKTFSLYYPSIDSATVQPLSMLAYAAANAWYALSKEPSVDPDRIGIVGHSFGGKWSMFASTLFDKYAAAVWSDPGIVFGEDRPSINYWEPWYLGYHPKPWRKRGLITKENPAFGLYLKLREEGYDLQELHALMAPRPFLVSGGSEDPVERWIPLNHSIEVNKLLGYDNRVGMSNRPKHGPTPESNEIVYSFFEYFLKYRGIDVK